MGPRNHISCLSYKRNWWAYTIFPVQLLYLEGVVSFQDYVVVELVPQGCRSELGAGEVGKRAQVDAIRSASNEGEQ